MSAAFVLVLSLGPLPLPQAPASGKREPVPPGVAALYGERSYTIEDFDRALCERLGDGPDGEEALRQIARYRIVEAEGSRRGLEVPDSEVRAMRETLDARLREAGEPSVSETLRFRAMTDAAFEDLLRLGLLHEKVVRADLGVPASEEIPPQRLNEWLDARIETAGIVSEGADLPAGARAVILGRPVTAAELGRSIRHGLGRERTHEILLETVGTRIVEEKAAELGLRPDEAAIDRELARIRRRVAAHPDLQEIPYEQLLRAAGADFEDLRRDPRVRAAVLLDAIVSRTFPAEAFAQEFERSRPRLEARYGEGRAVSWILLRAAETPDGRTARTFEDAERELRLLAERGTDAATFGRLASLHSEDEASRDSDGDLGVVHREASKLPPAAAAAAFEAPVGKPHGPVRVEGGLALLFVREVVPAPEDELLERLRLELRNRTYRDLLAERPVRTYLD